MSAAAAQSPALVLGLSDTGLGALRLLGTESIACWGIDTVADAPGYRSRYCSRGLHLPRGAPDAQWVDELERLGGQAPAPPVLMPTDDRAVRLVSRNRRRLERTCRVLMPDEELVSALLDKGQLAELAARHGWPVPAGQVVSGSDELLRAAADLGLPLIVKPCRRAGADGHGIGKALVISKPADLPAAADRISWAHDLRVIVQRLVPGSDESQRSVGVCLDRTGEGLATFTARKRRQGNSGAGVGSYVEARVDREAEALAVRVLRSIGYVGVAEVELKRHSATGELVLIEINPRLWTQVALPSAWGLNFPMLAYRLALDLPAEPQPSRPRRAYWQDLWVDFYLTFRRGGYRQQRAVSVGGWLWQTLRANTYAYASLRDPLPAAGRARVVLRQLMKA